MSHKVFVELMGTEQYEGASPYTWETHYLRTEKQANAYANKMEKEGKYVYGVDKDFDTSGWNVIIERPVNPGEFDNGKTYWTQSDKLI